MILCERYFSDESWEFLSDAINEYLNPERKYKSWMAPFMKFERSLYGSDTTWEDSMNIWNSLLFHVYVQTVQTPGRFSSPTKEQYENSEEAFFQVMERYQPDILIVWGLRLWNNLPNTNWTENARKCISGKYVDNGFYTLKSDQKVTSFPIFNPVSLGRFDIESWHEVISSFLDGELFIAQKQDTDEDKDDASKPNKPACHTTDAPDYAVDTPTNKEGIPTEINDYYSRCFIHGNIDQKKLYELIAKECSEKIKKQSEWFFLQKVLVVKRWLTTRTNPTEFGRFINNILIHHNICGYKKKRNVAGIDPTELTRYGNQSYYLNANNNIKIHWNDLDESEYNNLRDRKRQTLELDDIKNLCNELDKITNKAITTPQDGNDSTTL